jgi:hypothetical protein
MNQKRTKNVMRREFNKYWQMCMKILIFLISFLLCHSLYVAQHLLEIQTQIPSSFQNKESLTYRIFRIRGSFKRA